MPESAKHRKSDLAKLLRELDLGSSVAETDHLLETARVETSVFSDLLADRVDLIPGTKGSGKSALYRIFVDFLPKFLLDQRKVVVAHGVRSHGDTVFHAFSERFEQLSEAAFVDFWCVYLVSLAHEHFIKDPRYAEFLKPCGSEVDVFRSSCQAARIPEIQAKKSLSEVLSWALDAVSRRLRPRLSYKPSSDEVSLDLFGEGHGQADASETGDKDTIPIYVGKVRDDLEAILACCNLHLWLMVDRLDEVFPRRSLTETRALRGLLRTLQMFQTPHIRVKIFLRDDIFDQITSGGEGFTALTHVTARQADPLRWSEEQILTLVVNRLFAAKSLQDYLGIEPAKLSASREYQQQAFYAVFPPTVHSGKNQSPTLRWIYNHTKDGRDVVTPRDVIDLLTRAKQRQQDEFEADPEGSTDVIIGPAAILYGFAELSKKKRDTVLKAEFPHFWPSIEKLAKGKTEYGEAALQELFGKQSEQVLQNLVSIGVLSESHGKDGRTFKIPFIYREGLEVTQGRIG